MGLVQRCHTHVIMFGYDPPQLDLERWSRDEDSAWAG
jgi:hypothetical protein